MTDYSPHIRKLCALTLWGFVLVCVLLGYWQVARASQLNASRHNQRQALKLKRIEPGKISTRDGKVILDHQRTPRGWEATYPAGLPFCHLTGYGPQTGLQKGLRNALYGLGEYANPWRNLVGSGLRGNDVTLTLDGAAQELAVDELEDRRGAVVALDARTGGVLVLASAPGFDPEQVTRSQEEMDLLRFDPQSPELNRALQGKYPPGSVFKIFTTAVALNEGAAKPESVYSCAGTERVERAKVVCRRQAGHGRISLERALWDSCNITFAKVGGEIGVEKFIAAVKKFHLLDPADMALPSVTGGMYDFRGFKGLVALAEASFGQGATLMSPLQVARLTLTLANGGEVLQPTLLGEVRSPEGKVLRQGQARNFGPAVTPETAARVAGMMVGVVEKGTARPVAISGVKVAAKTGSAQNPHGPAHAWFTCFAPADKPQVVVTVVIEGGEAGSETAAPIARKLLLQLLDSRD